MGDGGVVGLDLYLATVRWPAQARQGRGVQADGGPLVGMALLYGSRVM
jgi:hypothetical protein